MVGATEIESNSRRIRGILNDNRNITRSLIEIIANKCQYKYSKSSNSGGTALSSAIIAQVQMNIKNNL